MKIHLTKNEGTELVKQALVEFKTELLRQLGVGDEDDIVITFSIQSQKNFIIVEKKNADRNDNISNGTK